MTTKNKLLTIRSMTGFGQAKREGAGVCFEMELRSLNHRFLEITVKLPKGLSSIEAELRAMLSSQFQRGKIEVLIIKKRLPSTESALYFDEDAFNSYYSIYKTVLESHGVVVDQNKEKLLLDIFAKSDVFPGFDNIIDIDVEKALILSGLEEASKKVQAMREDEGARMAADLGKRLNNLAKIREEILALAGLVPARMREKISARLKELLQTSVIDEARLATELVLYCDRADITEELLRLESHLAQFQAALGESGPGKKLDFLTQEFLRECNTVASKAQNAKIQGLIVEAKTEIEKMKEQIQNIE